MVSRLFASVWCKPTRAAGVRAATLRWLRCGWPCTAWPTARPQPGSCFAEFDRCAPASLLGFTPLPARCALGPASHESQCAARRAWPAGALRDGVDSLCADWRRWAPWERGVSGSGGARACSRERAGARATPTYLIHCARTCCSQRGSVRFAHAVLPIWASLRACFAPVRRSVGGAAGRARLAPGIGSARAARQATWLILPVVICLSQRLSHACLSISDLYCETANGSLNQLWFL